MLACPPEFGHPVVPAELPQGCDLAHLQARGGMMLR
jgi:hypothetical protein